jgi:hypothetical protein
MLNSASRFLFYCRDGVWWNRLSLIGVFHWTSNSSRLSDLSEAEAQFLYVLLRSYVNANPV